jgi:DNA-directed RNA polymerase specialized sigma24 family protein
MQRPHSNEPETATNPDGETPEQTAESLAEALDFLGGEADAAGLDDVGRLIRRASRRARERSGLLATHFYTLCRKIDRLPKDCRAALVLRKVYRRSCAEIAADCGISVNTARARVAQGFRLLLAASPDAAGEKAVEALVER